MSNYMTPIPTRSSSSGSVRSITVNGVPYLPDETGNVAITIEIPDVPEVPLLEVIEYPATNHTLTLLDRDNYLRIASGSAIVFSIPNDLELALPIGCRVYVEQAGVGEIQFTGPVTLLVKPSVHPKTAEIYSVATLIKVATDTWTLYGELASKNIPPPDPDPDPVQNQLVDSSGNSLVDQAGNILVYAESPAPEPQATVLVDALGNTLTDSLGNPLVVDEQESYSTYLVTALSELLVDDDSNQLIEE